MNSRRGLMGKVANRDSSVCSSTPAARMGQVTKTALTTKQVKRKSTLDHSGEAATAGRVSIQKVKTQAAAVPRARLAAVIARRRQMSARCEKKGTRPGFASALVIEGEAHSGGARR